MIAFSNKCLYTDNDEKNIKTSQKSAQEKKIIGIINNMLTHSEHSQK